MWKIGVKNEDIIKKVTNLASPLVYSMCQIAFSDRLFLSWLIKESSPVGYVPIVYFGYKRLIHNYIRRDERLLCSKRYFYISNESSAFTHICKFPSRYNLAYSSGSSIHRLQVKSMRSLIRVWFLNSFLPPNNQYGAYILHWYIHQYCFCVDYILQILFSSYLISLSFNQSSVTKIRSISISSPCHFYFVLYCFIEFSWSPLPLRSAQSRCPLDILCPCICPYQSS